MKIERTRNAARSITVGLVLKIYQMVVPFLMRTAMIHFMGVEYLGLNSLFTSILHMLNLAELGVGSAMVFSMYKPIAEDDAERICALMAIYRRYYRIIGLVIGAAGLILTPVVPYLISGELPDGLNVYVLYLLNLGATVLTYWLFAYRNCLLQAHQRLDIASKITLISSTVQYALQLLIMVTLKDYYLYVIVLLLSTVMNNILTAVMTARTFPQYVPKGKLPPEEVRTINGKIRDLFSGKIGYVVLQYADTIVISAFLGLTVLAVYQNYFFIITAVLAFIDIVISSITAGLGNSFVTETKEKNYRDMLKFTFLFLWVTGVSACCFLGMYQPFMQIWVGEELMLGFGMVVCFALYFFVYTFNRLIGVYKDAAGLWHQDRFRPLVTAMVNLGLNLLSVRFFGLYGVLLSTVISMVCVGLPWQMHILFSSMFEKNMLRGYLRLAGKFLLAVLLSGASVVMICLQIHLGPWLTLLLCALVSVIVPNAVFFLLLRKDAQFRPAVQFLDRLTKKKLRLEMLLFRTK